MALQPTHELHQRRFGRNLGVALVLVAFVALVFALTVVKVKRGESIEGFDHQIRPDLAVPPAVVPATVAPAANVPAANTELAP